MTEQNTPQEQPVLQLTLSVDAINIILSALGKMPTESGVFPLRMSIAEQAQLQLNELAAQGAADDSTEESTDE